MLAFDMPARLTREEVERLAALANLDLDPAEADLFGDQLADILTYVDQLQQIDTTGIPPTARVGSPERQAERPDEIRPCLDREEALAAAPDPARDAGFFKVPRVIE